MTDGLGELLLRDLRDCFVHPLRRRHPALVAAIDSPSGSGAWGVADVGVGGGVGVMMDVEDTRLELEALLDVTKWLQLKPREPPPPQLTTACSVLLMSAPRTQQRGRSALGGGARADGAVPESVAEEKPDSGDRPPPPGAASSAGDQEEACPADLGVGVSSAGPLHVSSSDDVFVAASAPHTRLVSDASLAAVSSADPQTSHRLDDLWHEALSPSGASGPGMAAAGNGGPPFSKIAAANPSSSLPSLSRAPRGSSTASRAASLPTPPAGPPAPPGVSQATLKGSLSVGRADRQLKVDVPMDPVATGVDDDDGDDGGGASEWPAIKFLRAASSEPPEAPAPVQLSRCPMSSETAPSGAPQGPPRPANGDERRSQGPTAAASGTGVGSLTASTAAWLHGSPSQKQKGGSAVLAPSTGPENRTRRAAPVDEFLREGGGGERGQGRDLVKKSSDGGRSEGRGGKASSEPNASPVTTNPLYLKQDFHDRDMLSRK